MFVGIGVVGIAVVGTAAVGTAAASRKFHDPHITGTLTQRNFNVLAENNE